MDVPDSTRYLYYGLNARSIGGRDFFPLYTIVFPLLGYHLEPVQAVEVGLLTEIFGFISSTSAFWRAGLIDFQIAGFAVLSLPQWR